MVSLRHHRGFTLIELLLVMGILAVLMFVVLTAINPNRQLGQARNARRQADIQSIIEAVSQYSIDKGYPPADIPQGLSLAKPLCQFSMTYAECDAMNGFHLRMLSGTYLPEMPKDPLLVQSGTGTRYKIYRNEDRRVFIFATGAEDGKSIWVAR